MPKVVIYSYIKKKANIKQDYINYRHKVIVFTALESFSISVSRHEDREVLCPFCHVRGL